MQCGRGNQRILFHAAFGTDCLKTSFQMRYSIINLPNINLGQLQIILAAVGLLSVLATVSCTLFLSAKCKDTLTVLLISIVVLLMPLFAYVAMGATWLSTILPSAGIDLKNIFLSQRAHFFFIILFSCFLRFHIIARQKCSGLSIWFYKADSE